MGEPVEERCRPETGRGHAQPISERLLADLHKRLSAMTIELPPLRERRCDIPLLYEHLLLMAAKRYGKPLPAVSPDEVRQMLGIVRMTAKRRQWTKNVERLRGAEFAPLVSSHDWVAVFITVKPWSGDGEVGPF